MNVSWCDLVWTCVFIAPGQTDMQEGKSRVVTLFPVHGPRALQTRPPSTREAELTAA